MAEFTYRNGVSVIQLIAFVVYLGFAFVLCSRHGFSRSSGWVILITFSLLRIIGASFELATIHYPSRSTYGGALICQSIGLSALAVLNLGLLSRVNRFVNVVTRPIFTFLSIASFTGISLAIYGGTKAAKSDNPLGSNTQIKAAVCIFTGIYVATFGIFLTLLKHRSRIPRPEVRLLICFAICTPFICVRLLYALIADFANNPDFRAFNGNVTILLCMAVLEEIFVVGFCVATGMTLRVLPKEDSKQQKNYQMEGSTDSRSAMMRDVGERQNH